MRCTKPFLKFKIRVVLLQNARFAIYLTERCRKFTFCPKVWNRDRTSSLEGGGTLLHTSVTGFPFPAVIKAYALTLAYSLSKLCMEFSCERRASLIDSHQDSMWGYPKIPSEQNR